MTKEELEKEAEKFLGGWLIDPEIVKLLVDFAAPREKRIAELEKENAKLKAKLKEHESIGNAQFWENVWSWKTKADQLTKAKVALRNVIDYLGQFCSDYPDCVIEAEKILKEE